MPEQHEEGRELGSADDATRFPDPAFQRHHRRRSLDTFTPYATLVQYLYSASTSILAKAVQSSTSGHNPRGFAAQSNPPIQISINLDRSIIGRVALGFPPCHLAAPSAAEHRVARLRLLRYRSDGGSNGLQPGGSRLTQQFVGNHTAVG